MKQRKKIKVLLFCGVITAMLLVMAACSNDNKPKAEIDVQKVAEQVNESYEENTDAFWAANDALSDLQDEVFSDLEYPSGADRY